MATNMYIYVYYVDPTTFSSSGLPNPASHRNPAGYSFLLPSHLLQRFPTNIFPPLARGFPTVSLYFPIHPLRGFSVCFVQHFLTTCFLPFSPLSSMGFCTISSGFLHFQCISKSFTRLLHFPIVFAPFPLVVITFSCAFTLFFQHFYCIVIVCS